MSVETSTYRSRAPVRISFGGGGTDVPPYCDEKGGCVLNAAIGKYNYGSAKWREDGKIVIESADYVESLLYHNTKEMEYDNKLDLVKAVIKKMNNSGRGVDVYVRSEIAPKSGLGSSASAFVALIGMFDRMNDGKMEREKIAEMAVRLEREELGNFGGKQDQYAAAIGGINFLEFEEGGKVKVEKVRIRTSHVLELEKSLILVNAAERVASGDIITDQMQRYKKKEGSTEGALDRTKEIAKEARRALEKGDLEEFASLLDEAWKSKKKFSPLITNSKIDGIYEAAKKAGALGGKISGAGGGGHMFFYCEANKEHKVAEKMRSLGLVPEGVKFDFEGLRTWEI